MSVDHLRLLLLTYVYSCFFLLLCSKKMEGTGSQNIKRRNSKMLSPLANKEEARMSSNKQERVDSKEMEGIGNKEVLLTLVKPSPLCPIQV